MHKIPSRIIDFHVHLFPDKMSDAIWDFFAREYRLDILYKFYWRARGVVTIVYSNYAHRQGVAEGLNDWNLQILEENPGLYCFGAYHPDDPNALAYADKLLNHPRVLGIKLHHHVQRFHPHDRRLFPLYELICTRKKRLLLHAGSGPLGNEFVGFDHFKKLLAVFPDLPANIAHMGQFEYQEFMHLLDDHPALYLDTAFSFFKEQQNKGGYSLGSGPLEQYKDRILYGSDFPNLILPRDSELETLSACSLSDDFYRKVFYENAAKLLGLDPEA